MTARLRWHAVRTKPRQEGVALENLTRQGYEAFLPMIPTVGRRRRRTEAPLFPGYLFVGVKAAEQAYGPIRSTFGVVGLVRFGDHVPELPEAVIAALQEREQRLRDPNAMGLSAGDKVMIVDGPFAGLNGVFEVANGADRVLVLLDLLGRNVSTTLARSDIAPQV
ncbi:transcription termination/antitermination protein NusG [Thiohalocapsa halophila]|nr:transcriptional activator RfaH [Thiohalocapsa halophila]